MTSIKTVQQLFARADEHAISINARKMVYAQSSVTFGGFIVDVEGFRPDPGLLRSISEFPKPLKQRIRLALYWPNMDAKIANMVSAGDKCVARLPSHLPEPLHPHEPASRPFEQVHSDLGSLNGRHFLVLVDQYSGGLMSSFFRI